MTLEERKLLERAATTTGSTPSDVLRYGLRLALESLGFEHPFPRERPRPGT